jgi:hypothetical protein
MPCARIASRCRRSARFGRMIAAIVSADSETRAGAQSARIAECASVTSLVGRLQGGHDVALGELAERQGRGRLRDRRRLTGVVVEDGVAGGTRAGALRLYAGAVSSGEFSELVDADRAGSSSVFDRVDRLQPCGAVGLRHLRIPGRGSPFG